MGIASKPVTIRGVTYPSRMEAARRLGVVPNTVRWAVKRGRLDNVGLSEKREPVPVKIRGTHYPSINAAAKALGVSQTTVFQALERGTLDNVGLTKERLKRC